MSASMTIMLDAWRDVADEEIVELETAWHKSDLSVVHALTRGDDSCCHSRLLSTPCRNKRQRISQFGHLCGFHRDIVP
jgi:hypothetical protein